MCSIRMNSKQCIYNLLQQCLEIQYPKVKYIYFFVFNMYYVGMDQTAKEIKAGGGKSHSYVVDVSSREEIYKAAKLVQQEVGKIDILINNAGIAEGDLLVDLADEKIEKSFQVNILAHYWVCNGLHYILDSTLEYNLHVPAQYPCKIILYSMFS